MDPIQLSIVASAIVIDTACMASVAEYVPKVVQGEVKKLGRDVILAL